MNSVNPGRHVELSQQIRAHEAQTAEHLATIAMLEERWEDYRHVMRENTARFEEAGISTGEKNYLVQKDLAAQRELDSFVGQLANEQAQLLEESAREIRSNSEAELERLHSEKAGA